MLSTPNPPGVREQMATRVAFFITGLSISSWAPLIPLVKAKLNLDEATLGALLLCIGLGSVIAMPFSGGLASHFGCRKVITTTALLFCLTFPVMAFAPNIGVLAIALLLFGAGLGVTDVVMNIQAVIVEKASGKAMMSGFHGMYSVAGIAGAGGMTALLSLGFTPLVGATVISALCVLAILVAMSGWLPYATDEKTPAFAFPRGKVLLLGLLCFALFLAEGSVLDWSGILLTSHLGVADKMAGIGYAAFAITMTIGRLTGDKFVHRLGPKMVLFGGSLCAAFGFVLASLVPLWPVSVLGFALVGVGASNAVPVMFSAAGRQNSMPSNLALASVTTFGYAGILVGPACIGFLAKAVSMPVALLAVAAMLVGVAFCANAATQE